MKKKIPTANVPSKRHGCDGPRRSYSSCSDLDGAYTDDQVEFLKAIDAYKRDNHRPFPTWSEVLAIVRALGYRKVADPQ